MSIRVPVPCGGLEPDQIGPPSLLARSGRLGTCTHTMARARYVGLSSHATPAPRLVTTTATARTSHLNRSTAAR